jgi:hypothetical protein
LQHLALRASAPNPLEADVRSGAAAVVLACWHEELLPLLWHGRGFGLGWS